MTWTRPRTRPLAAWPMHLLLALGLCCCSEGPNRPTNVLLITVDTLRADHLTPYGSARNTSPFLAEFAQEGLLFQDAISQCGTTPQSLSSLMTGLYPYTDGILTQNDAFHYLDRGQHTLAAAFSKQGYRTHAITASIQSSTATGVELGFESFDGVSLKGRVEATKRRTADQITALALEWLESQAAAEEPFFLWLHYLDPHHPYSAPASHAHHFRKAEPREEGDTKLYRFDELGAGVHALSDGELERLNLDYDREIRFTDEALRSLFDSAPVLSRNTLSLFTADHGEALGSNGIITHNDLYDSIVRVPLIMRWPGRVKGGEQTALPVMLVDIAPTLHDLMGLDSPGELRGTSLRPWLLPWLSLAERASSQSPEPDPTAPLQRLRRAEYADQSATYDGRLKLIDRPTGVELFDRLKDPGETRNVAARRVERASALLEAGRKLAQSPLRPKQDPGSDSSGAAVPAPPEVTQEMLDELKALGYLGDS